MATTLELSNMAHGGSAVGRDERGRVIFVPYGIPGETVSVEVAWGKRFGQGNILEVLHPSDDRVAPPCQHFGVCGGCHFQHINYPAQLKLKQRVVADQLARVGGIKNATVRPTLPNPEPYYYRVDTSLSPSPEGGLGYWAPALKRVMSIETCYIIREPLRQLFEAIDLELPGLRRLTLRVGDDGDLLAAIEVAGVEPPALQTDLPLSIAIVLPDETAANLVGDNFIVQSVRGRDFRVSAGVFFHPSPPAAALLIETVLKYADLSDQEYVLEGYSGAGTLTGFLADKARSVIAVEQNPDAVADAAVNLDEWDNIFLYEGPIEAILPELEIGPDVIVVDPPAEGLSEAAWRALQELEPARFIYSSQDLGTLARDARKLTGAGYRLAEIQPIDMFPQNFQVQTVSLWQ